MRVTHWNTVPEFALALVEKIYSSQLQVLLVPAEQSLPRTYVAVGRSHSSHVEVHCFSQRGVKCVQVPLATALVHQRLSQVSAVERGRKHNILPELSDCSLTML